MKTKIRIFMLIALLASLALSVYITVYANNRRVLDVLLIVPKQPINTAIDYDAIEDKNGDEYLLTYEANNAANIQALNKSYDVVLKGTNYLYPYVINNRILAGSFFPEDAQIGRRKVAVLNKKAAFDIFGSLDISNGEIRIDGDIFTVTGVIDDKDKDNLNIFIPVCFSEKEADSFAALIDSNDKTPEAATENILKQFNINENLYEFYNLNKFVDSINTRLYLSLHLTLMAAAGIALIAVINLIIKKIKHLKKESLLWDYGELLSRNKGNIALLLGMAILSVALIVSISVSGINIVSCILVLKDVDAVILSDYSSGFSNIIYLFNKLSMYSLAALIIFGVVLALYICMLIINSFFKQKNLSENKQ